MGFNSAFKGLNFWIRPVILHETSHRYLELLTIRRVSAQNLTLFTRTVECTALKAILVRRWIFVISIQHWYPWS